MVDRSDSTEDIFERARQIRDPNERKVFLDKACGESSERRAELDALLAQDDSDGPFDRLMDALAHRRASLSTAIGSYQILKVVGEGGMGVVYLAEQQQLKRLVALKVIRPGVLTPGSLHRFRREVTLLGKLQHPHIAQIFDAGTFDQGFGEEPYFAMEYVEGPSLLAYLDDVQPDDQTRLTLFRKIAEAVHHAHQKGVIHRDLKPGNILVDRRGQPRILDFGIAKATNSDAETTRQTHEGQLMGTLLYMSPEQVEGDLENLDIRTDVYSLGVVLYELLTGEHPYPLKTSSAPEIIQFIRDRDPTPLETVSRRFRGDLDTIVAKALEKDPERRYSSAYEMAEDVRRFQHNEPITARRASRLYHIRKFARRNPTLVLGTVTTILALALGLVASLQQAQKTARALEQSEAFSTPGEYRRLIELANDDLWPRRPQTVPRLELWIEQIEALVVRLPKVRSEIERIRRGEGERAALGEWTFASLTAQTRHDDLTWCVQELEAAQSSAGIIAQVDERLRIAQRIEAETIDEYLDEWAYAIDDIAEDETYGFELSPQIGLVPLEKNTESGLWEFWHWESGQRPQRRTETEPWHIDDDTGIVLVLIPGGVYVMGCQKDDPDKPNYDPLAQPWEGPVHTIALDPFFMSKYEITQGQWIRFTGENLSVYREGKSFLIDPVRPLAHPVNNISWVETAWTLKCHGLVIPTEAQWEFAALAGVDRQKTLNEKPVISANLEGINEAASDSFEVHAPVGVFPANRFGLHDIVGNVGEYCREGAYQGSYEKFKARDGDGYRAIDDFDYYSFRGSNFKTPRGRNREVLPLDIRFVFGPTSGVGVRPSMPILEDE